MNENTPDNIPGITQPFNSRKTGKKQRRKPLSPTRKLYEEEHPPIGVRINRGPHMQLHIDAKAANMDLGEYLESLIENNHTYIETIKATAFKEGKQSRQKEVDEAFNNGLKQGVVNDYDRIWNQAFRAGQEKSALWVWCANWERGCRHLIPIERDTKAAEIAVNAVYQQLRLICPTCEWNAILSKYTEKPKPPRPSWLPSGYPW